MGSMALSASDRKRALAVVGFWRAAGPRRWFSADPVFDRLVRLRLRRAHADAAAGRLRAWMNDPDGTLALLILLDQAPRNMFRGTARVYAADAVARQVARSAIRRGFHRRVPTPMRQFFFLPFMHSEDVADQRRCIALYRAAGDADGLHWAEHHAGIVERFGRFPHRNAILGRMSTEDEMRFLADGGFSG